MTAIYIAETGVFLPDFACAQTQTKRAVKVSFGQAYSQ